MYKTVRVNVMAKYKTKSIAHFELRIPNRLNKRLQKIADSQDTTKNRLISRILREWEEAWYDK